MTVINLMQAIQDCDSGEVEFNAGEVRSFLYKRKWYPLRAIINHAAHLAGEDEDITTDRALVKLVYLGLWTRVKDVSFDNQTPVEIASDEINIEVKELSKILFKLTN